MNYRCEIAGDTGSPAKGDKESPIVQFTLAIFFEGKASIHTYPPSAHSALDPHGAAGPVVAPRALYLYN